VAVLLENGHFCPFFYVFVGETNIAYPEVDLHHLFFPLEAQLDLLGDEVHFLFFLGVVHDDVD
jgi:hypothetical protein